MKIGIPKSLVIYENIDFYDNFFRNLGIDIVYSHDTNINILNDGIKYSVSENCLSSKIFMGHVANLVQRSKKENIDYIFIPRIAFFSKRETTCVKFYALYDNCKNVFDANFLCLNIDKSKKKNTELLAYIDLGRKLGVSIKKVIESYVYAKRIQKNLLQKEYVNQFNKLSRCNKNVLIVAHSYIAYDKFLTGCIYDYLRKNGINIVFANINKNVVYSDKEEYKKISKGIYWKYNKYLLDGLYEYKDAVDGIIFISTFPCGIDSLVNELAIRYLDKKHVLNIIIDEQLANAGLETRLESFVDIISGEYINNLKESV